MSSLKIVCSCWCKIVFSPLFISFFSLCLFLTKHIPQSMFFYDQSKIKRIQTWNNLRVSKWWQKYFFLGELSLTDDFISNRTLFSVKKHLVHEFYGALDSDWSIAAFSSCPWQYCLSAHYISPVPHRGLYALSLSFQDKSLITFSWFVIFYWTIDFQCTCIIYICVQS